MSKTYTIAESLNIAAAIEKKGVSLWECLVRSINACTYDIAVALCKEAEGAWVAERKGREIPSTYRSNKSVALNALKNGIALIEDDKVRGKSDVEKALKDAKGEKATMDKIRSTLDTLQKLYDACADADERRQARSLLADMSIRLFEQAKAQGEAA